MFQNVPVLMYHSVGMPNKLWNWNYLTCPYNVFEKQLLWLKNNKYTSINLIDLYEYIFLQKTIPKKSIILTFDDGYVDNWIYAYPLLKKHGFKGTIFVNPEFIDPRDIKRKRIDQVTTPGTLATEGFLSWEEMLEMEKDGTIDIQSHANSHTHYPISNKIIDFRHPNDEYIWMTWNSNIEKKPFLQIDDEKLKHYGEPVYEMGTSLGNSQFFPDDKLKEHLINFVKDRGSNKFYEEDNWLNILYEIVNKYSNNNNLEELRESQENYKQRIKDEITISKHILSKKLNKEIDFLCWPEGSGSKIGWELANKAGYKMSTAAKDIPKLRKLIPNSPKMITDRIRRISTAAFWNGIEGFNSKVSYASGIELRLKIFAFRNFLFSKYWANLLLILKNKFK